MIYVRFHMSRALVQVIGDAEGREVLRAHPDICEEISRRYRGWPMYQVPPPNQAPTDRNGVDAQRIAAYIAAVLHHQVVWEDWL